MNKQDNKHGDKSETHGSERMDEPSMDEILASIRRIISTDKPSTAEESQTGQGAGEAHLSEQEDLQNPPVQGYADSPSFAGEDVADVYAAPTPSPGVQAPDAHNRPLYEPENHQDSHVQGAGLLSSEPHQPKDKHDIEGGQAYDTPKSAVHSENADHFFSEDNRAFNTFGTRKDSLASDEDTVLHTPPVSDKAEQTPSAHQFFTTQTDGPAMPSPKTEGEKNIWNAHGDAHTEHKSDVSVKAPSEEASDKVSSAEFFTATPYEPED